jgi:carbon storage regulator
MIAIGDDVVITVVDIRGDKVRLGIQAPIEVSVHRMEVYEAIRREIAQGLPPKTHRLVNRSKEPR